MLDVLSRMSRISPALDRHRYIVERVRKGPRRYGGVMPDRDGSGKDRAASIDNRGILGRMPA
ncbi:hypothetical protein HMPREF1549_02527 [Actinomyces johnsonii F0510]|uniref:Uncharacterized protein n=1 Tax=Actinomyces johnsonii F0510 TaxID=1227262 RepID=U1PIC7_9ACTO|nr:hypothetical protein HMPREF1549_02527 [Actinomyces johnsonii F0510]